MKTKLLYIDNLSKQSFWKNFFCIFLIVVLVALFFPCAAIKAFADGSDNIDQNNANIYATKAYWESRNLFPEPLDSIEPGQVINTGIYLIDHPIVVAKPQAGQNGFEISGDVTFIFVNNGKSSITVEGGDAQGMMGAGAGIYLAHDNIFHVKGVGYISVRGGEGVTGEIGSKGGDASYSSHLVIFNDFVSGAGGDGGAGGGGAGAAIGTKGANGSAGGKGGESIKEDEEFVFDHVGKSGSNGEINSNYSEDAGIFKLSGNVELYATGGNISENVICNWGQAAYGKEVEYWDGHIKVYVAGGGGGGGAGGTGAPGAVIGSGGIGGAGGGGGGGGGTAWTCTAFEHKDFFRPNAGGGGAGASYMGGCKGGAANPSKGKFELGAVAGTDSDGNGDYGKGGIGAQDGPTKDADKCPDGIGGKGADGGALTGRSGWGGCVLWSKDSSFPGTKEFDGKEAQHIQVFPVDECEVQIDWEASTDEHFENEYFYYTGSEIKPVPKLIHKPTGKEIKMNSGAFTVSYLNNINVGDNAIIKLSGTGASWDHPTLCDSEMTTWEGDSTVITTSFVIKNK